MSILVLFSHLLLGLPNVLLLSEFPTEFYRRLSSLHACYMSLSSHFPLFDHRMVTSENYELLVVLFCPASY
jgi:hypothetical protein